MHYISTIASTPNRALCNISDTNVKSLTVSTCIKQFRICTFNQSANASFFILFHLNIKYKLLLIPLSVSGELQSQPTTTCESKCCEHSTSSLPGVCTIFLQCGDFSLGVLTGVLILVSCCINAVKYFLKLFSND